MYSDRSIYDEKTGKILDDTKIEEKVIIDEVRNHFFNGASDIIESQLLKFSADFIE